MQVDQLPRPAAEVGLRAARAGRTTRAEPGQGSPTSARRET
jgi:hypothetical protein